MNIEYVGRHFHLDDEIKQYTEEQLEKVLTFVDEPVEARVSLTVEKHRDNAHHAHLAEIHLSHRHGHIEGEHQSTEMHESIHQAAVKVEKQARRSKKKHLDQRRRRDRVAQRQQRWSMDVLERGTTSQADGPRVVRSSHLPIETMTLDEAAASLEGAKNDFVIYRDARQDRVQILYKRKDQNYGLLVPEI